MNRTLPAAFSDTPVTRPSRESDLIRMLEQGRRSVSELNRFAVIVFARASHEPGQ